MPKRASPSDIVTSTTAYDAWLCEQLGRGLVTSDLALKHDLMARSPFRFLRATYWRWCEVIPAALPELLEGPTGAAVGDIHMDNFGTFRDVEGRLVWGVNDVDEAARMPLALDLLRLATSAALRLDKTPTTAIVRWLVSGYRAGLKSPKPIVLDRDFDWLRTLVHVPDEARQEFWDELAALEPGRPPKDMSVALRASMPEPRIPVTFAPRSAGGGSLGRPRWVAIGTWRGGSAVREAKRLVPSAWVYAKRARSAGFQPVTLARGPHRAPDPYYRQIDASLIVRRLSPNNRKIEAKSLLAHADIERVLDVMGRDLGAIHAATPSAAAAMTTYVAETFDAAQLAALTDRTVRLVTADFDAWRAHHSSNAKSGAKTKTTQ